MVFVGINKFVNSSQQALRHVSHKSSRFFMPRFTSSPDTFVKQITEVAAGKLRSVNQCVNELLRKLEETDRYTLQHSLAVSKISAAFAKSLSLKPEQVERVKYAALLHDVGKTYIPRSILNKPKSLLPSEREVIETHSILGAQKISKEYPELQEFTAAIKHHHENWNGGGYPARLSSTQIPIEARIISIADTYHALLGRHYKDGSHKQACSTLLEGAGKQWDPALVDKFINFISKCEVSAIA